MSMKGLATLSRSAFLFDSPARKRSPKGPPVGGMGSENPGEQGGGDPVDVEPSWWNGEFNVKFTRIMPGEVPDRSNDWLEITNLGSEEVSLDGNDDTEVPRGRCNLEMGGDGGSTSGADRPRAGPSDTGGGG